VRDRHLEARIVTEAHGGDDAPITKRGDHQIGDILEGDPLVEGPQQNLARPGQQTLSLIRAAAFRHILHHVDEVFRLSSRVPQQRDRQVRPHQMPVLVQVPLLAMVGVDLPSDQLLQPGHLVRDVVGVSDVLET
jgi:hypothetical protein